MQQVILIGPIGNPNGRNVINRIDSFTITDKFGLSYDEIEKQSLKCAEEKSIFEEYEFKEVILEAMYSAPNENGGSTTSYFFGIYK